MLILGSSCLNGILVRLEHLSRVFCVTMNLCGGQFARFVRCDRERLKDVYSAGLS